ncbi:MAG: MDR family MFS transporter [Candidatus Daviesbacteria bacterium]|nr:MDR family MFS transporter [Candidatus Daviesbacteria bacterium]
MLANIPKTQKIFVMLGVMLAMLLAALDQTIVATAMPKIVSELHGLEHLSWVFTSYLLASTVIVPIYGKLSDIYGRKYFILTAIVIFLIGSVLSGISQTMLQLIGARAIQGLGGGAIMANAFAIIGDLFPPAERGRWQGLFGGVFGLASILGPALGGYLTDYVSWRWNFFINIPIGILAILVVVFLMPKIVPDIKDRSIDFLGSITLTISLVSLLLGLVWGGSQYPWLSWETISLFALAFSSGSIFLAIETKVRQPILPLDLFKNPVFSVSMFVIFLSGFGMFGAILFIPVFAQLVLGISATHSGTIMTPMTLGIVFASIISGQVVSRTGRYKWIAVVGLGIVTIGIFLMSNMSTQITRWELIYRMVITGVGLGMTMPTFTLVVQNAFDHSKLGVATASTQLFRSIGGTVGTAILGGILNASLLDRFGHLSSDNFVKTIAQINPDFNLSQLNASQLQNLLTEPGRVQIEMQLNNLPPTVKPQAMIAFNEFLVKIKEAFAASISEVFLITSGFMFMAFIASFFLKEISLRKSHLEPLEEAGVELANDSGVFPAKDEPSLRR